MTNTRPCFRFQITDSLILSGILLMQFRTRSYGRLKLNTAGSKE